MEIFRYRNTGRISLVHIVQNNLDDPVQFDPWPGFTAFPWLLAGS